MPVSNQHGLDQIRRVEQKKRSAQGLILAVLQSIQNGYGASASNKLLAVVKIGREPAQNIGANPV